MGDSTELPMMSKVEIRDVVIAYNNLVSLETYLIVLRNELLRSMTIHNLVPPFLIGEESFFLDETTEVTVDICQVMFVPFMMRRWETSPILLLNRSLWINRKDGMTRVPSVDDQCDPQAIMQDADAEALDDLLIW
jgi:hypothetical protein